MYKILIHLVILYTIQFKITYKQKVFYLDTKKGAMC
jgi:hypothetical protein